MRQFVVLSVLAASVTILTAQAQDSRATAIASAQGAAAARAASLAPGTTLVPVDVIVDDIGQAHVRYQQTFRGIPVFEGEAIVHVDLATQSVIDTTDALLSFDDVDTRPGPGAPTKRAGARWAHSACRQDSPPGRT